MQMRKRILTSRAYTPVWKDFEGYCVHFLKSNYWRVHRCMEYDDTLQECYLLFLKLKKHYGNVDTKKHFMGLFGTAMTNKFNDLAAKATKYKAEVRCFDESEHEDGESRTFVNLSNSIGDFNNDGMLAIMIEQAPSEIKLVLDLFLNAPVEVLDMFTENWKTRGNCREFGNSHLCEILGLEQKTDIIGAVKNYFAGTAV